MESTRERMRSVHGVHKFLCIKFIVLLTLWQEAIMKGMIHAGTVSSHFRGPYKTWEPKDAGNGMVNMLICLEMLLFAEWHRYAYSYKEELPQESYHECVSDNKFTCSRCCCVAIKKFWFSDMTGFTKMYRDIFKLRHASWQQHCAVWTLKKHIRGRGFSKEQEGDLREAFGKFDHTAEGNVTVAQLKFLLVEGGVANDREAEKLLFQTNGKSSNNHTLSENEFLDAVYSFCASGKEDHTPFLRLLPQSGDDPAHYNCC